MDNTITGEVKSPSIDIEEFKRTGKTFRENAGASIIDIGDRVALVEFHTKANSINSDIIEMLSEAVHESVGKFDGIVIGNRGRHFSAGANLPFLLETARTGKWKEMDQSFQLLQKVNMTLKYGRIPVVAAPFSNALGGGCEIVLHSSRVIAAEALHMGLVEAGVGLVPAGGGTKELGLRAQLRAAVCSEVDMTKAIQKVFDTIISARVSHDGIEAKELFLSEKDMVVKDQDVLIEMAKQTALELIQSGYRSGEMKTDLTVLGQKGINLFTSHIDSLVEGKVMSEHDAIIAKHVATILCGGNSPVGVADEQHFLDLEREAFLSLLGTEKTQERIEYLLKNNKQLRN